jgi:acetyl-CoA acetyltransferase
MTGIVVAGVGMTRFRKISEGGAYESMGLEAARAALLDAGLDYRDLGAVYASYAAGETSAGQAVVYPLGLTGVPVFNVNNACASGSTALYLARQAIASGEVNAALVVGFEQMGRSFTRGYPDQRLPVQWIDDRTRELVGADADVSTVGWFAAAAREYLEMTAQETKVLAMVAAKARRHAHANPNAAFRELLSVEDIMASKVAVDPLTKFECSAPSNGAAAVVLASQDFAHSRKLRGDVALVAQVMKSDLPSAWSGSSMLSVTGADMSRAAASELYERTGIGPQDLQLVELHDCFASNELISYEALGFAAHGEGGKLASDGDNSYGGRWVINPSGGLLGKGHPIGATGVAQCVEITMQLRGEAADRQVDGARLALQHNLGLGGACVVGLYQRI